MPCTDVFPDHERGKLRDADAGGRLAEHREVAADEAGAVRDQYRSAVLVAREFAPGFIGRREFVMLLGDDCVAGAAGFEPLHSGIEIRQDSQPGRQDSKHCIKNLARLRLPLSCGANRGSGSRRARARSALSGRHDSTEGGGTQIPDAVFRVLPPQPASPSLTHTELGRARQLCANSRNSGNTRLVGSVARPAIFNEGNKSR